MNSKRDNNVFNNLNKEKFTSEINKMLHNEKQKRSNNYFKININENQIKLKQKMVKQISSKNQKIQKTFFLEKPSPKSIKPMFKKKPSTKRSSRRSSLHKQNPEKDVTINKFISFKNFPLKKSGFLKSFSSWSDHLTLELLSCHRGTYLILNKH